MKKSSIRALLTSMPENKIILINETRYLRDGSGRSCVEREFSLTTSTEKLKEAADSGQLDAVSPAVTRLIEGALAALARGRDVERMATSPGKAFMDVPEAQWAPISLAADDYVPVADLVLDVQI